MIPLVEVMCTAWTDKKVADTMRYLLADVGKTLVLVNKDVPGFIGNRLQDALWREAVSLVENDICGAAAVDTVNKSAGAMLAAPVILESTRAYAATPTLRIGHVSLSTGPLAGFAEADSYVLSGTEEALSGGVENNGKFWNVEIVSTDSQSNLNRASEIAADLILGE